MERRAQENWALGEHSQDVIVLGGVLEPAKSAL